MPCFVLIVSYRTILIAPFCAIITYRIAMYLSYRIAAYLSYRIAPYRTVLNAPFLPYRIASYLPLGIGPFLPYRITPYSPNCIAPLRTFITYRIPYHTVLKVSKRTLPYHIIQAALLPHHIATLQIEQTQYHRTVNNAPYCTVAA